MGSCLSKTGLPSNGGGNDDDEEDNKGGRKPVSNQDLAVERAFSGGAGASPSPPVPPRDDDEAVVKEVMTETPVPPVVLLTSQGALDVKAPPHKDGTVPAAADNICSVSESLSASAATVAEATDNGEMGMTGSVPAAPLSKWRSPELSPAAKVHLQRHRLYTCREFPSCRDQARSCARRPLPGREATRRTSLRQVADHCNDTAARVVRGDQGERSGRRSASPAARREANVHAAGGGRGGEGVSRSSLTRRVSTQPKPLSHRRTTPAAEAVQKRGRGVAVEKEHGQLGVAGRPATAMEESLENPVIILECFIFL